MEWDVASADVILSEAGGGIFEYDENFKLANAKRIVYNKKNLCNCDFIAL